MMAFVPDVTPRQPSPRAQEMGQRFALTIAEYRQKYPDLSEEEVRQALALASERSPEGARSARSAIVAVAGGVAVAAGVGAYLVGGRVPFLDSAAFPAFVAAAVAVIAAVVARRRRE
jgi:hypothetical protein